MSWIAAIQRHYADVWGVAGQPCDPITGPVGDLPNGFVVLKYPPHGSRRMWTYATCGMSLPTDETCIELHIFSPRESLDLVEILFVVADFHRTAHRLGVRHSVNLGRPWLDGSKCDHCLISLPYLDGPDLETLRSGSKAIKCYWLIPITAAEVEFKKRHGTEALEQRMEAANFNYVDPGRTSVV